MTEFKEPVLHKIPTSDKGFTLVHYDWNANIFDISKVEEKFNAKYVGEFTLKTKDGYWANKPVSIFYTEKKHPKGSNYFGIFMNGITLVIANGISAAENIWLGVVDPETNEILYSAYRHDYQVHNKLITDGGADYLRSSTHPVVQFKIENGTIKILGRKVDDKSKERS